MKKLFLFIICAALSFLSFGQFSFVSHQYALPGGVWGSKLAAGDFNGDGRTDIITSLSVDNFNNGNIFYLFLQNASGSFDSVPQQIPYPQICCGVISMTAIDMDGDGLDDLVTCSGDSIYIYYQSVSHTLTPFLRGHYTGAYLADGDVRIGDMDRDGYKDLTMLTGTPSERILYGTGIRDSFVTMDYQLSSSSTNISVNELGKVGTNPDLSILHAYTTYNGGTSISGHVMAEHINSSRQIDTTMYYDMGPIWQGINDIATIDRRGDGNYAIMATTEGNYPNSTLAIWGHPDHPGSPDTIMTVFDNAQVLAQGDFNCSGSHELIIAHGGYNISVINANNQITTMYADLPNNMAIGDMLLADVTGDGRLDIVLVNTYVGVLVFENTTPVAAPDTLILATHLIGSDTVVVSQLDSTISLRDTIYAAGDTVVAKIISRAVTYHEQDTMRTIFRSRLTFQNCHADSVFVTDTVVTESMFITTDSAYTIIGYDTIVTLPGSGAMKVRIYPNPFTSGITIEGADSTARIEIYDQMGSLALSESCGGNCYISSNILPQGIYIVKVIWPGTIYHNKIVSLSSF